MSESRNNDEGTSLPFARTERKFRGFPEFRSNVLYCPKQFFTIVVPNSSVNCIRIVSYMLRKTLGWVDESGDPIQEQHALSYGDLENDAGIVHSGLGKAIREALDYKFIRCVQKPRMQVQGVRARSAAYELVWNESTYTDSLDDFGGFYLQPSYTDRDGQNRIGRKNIPNIFFDHVVRNENRSVIRVVGTLLWYSIDWGKGGERKRPVQKSLRDLVELTRLQKKNVLLALDEAEEKGFVERLERGVFDFSGRGKSTATVYGIHWTSDYTYTYEGLPVAVSEEGERSKKDSQPLGLNAPKKTPDHSVATLQKRLPENLAERSKKDPRNAPEKTPGERSKKDSLVITKTSIPNTPINNNSGSPLPDSPVAAAELALLEIGFDRKAAREIGASAPAIVILRQIELLPKRNSSKNPLGLLRRAIEENWAAPSEPKTKDVFSSPGAIFAASFYAGYHGNSDAPVSDPSPADSEAAEKFVTRLLGIWPDPSQTASWGRQFGGLVAQRHGERRENFPALRPAIQRHGDDFYSRLRRGRETEQKEALQKAQSAHYGRYQNSYLEYLRAELARNEAENTGLFQALKAEEAEKLNVLRTNQFGLNVEQITEQYLASRLERFQQFLVFQEGHGVLDFWQWDKERNPETFRGVEG